MKVTPNFPFLLPTFATSKLIKMRILLLGGGGREHAFAWKLNQSKSCEHLYIAPGNAGTNQIGTNVDISPSDFEAVKKFVLETDINMVIVGPEQPLVDGIVDFFENDLRLSEIQIIGPNKTAAQLEGSKAFAKDFMYDNQIPTAGFREFTKDSYYEGLEYIDNKPTPIVLKADGLAAGKGVVILNDREAAKKEFTDMINGKFGAASASVVIEDFLKGIEFSVFVLTDGVDYKILPVAKDYKRIGEQDTGLNTGGMGAISPLPFLDEEMMQQVEEKIIQPTISGLQKKDIRYNGFIFIGLIKVDGKPYVIEYNCRMGDPETEVVLPRLKNDLVELLASLDNGNLKNQTIEMDERTVSTVMLVSGGYPETYQKGFKIDGLNEIKDSILFHAGTKADNGKVLTNGGRVIAITSFGNNIAEAIATSKKNAAIIDFEGKYYRKDIGFDL